MGSIESSTVVGGKAGYDGARSSRLEVKGSLPLPDDLLTIGELARLTGRSTSSIRHYELIGLLPEPARRSGQRRYDDAAVRMLAVIDTARRAGLALDDIRDLLAGEAGDGAGAIEHLRTVAGRKLREVAATIERAEMIQQWLAAAARCECPDLHACSLFDGARLPAVPAGRGIPSLG